ncbi:MAG: NUDIX hydrolase [Bacteroidales bacterium]|nr:NUDIX hydrolase [Bacteroidales bacterium]
MSLDWLHIAKELQSLAQAGLTYGENKYDIERYQRLREISAEVLAHYADMPLEKVRFLFASEEGYLTPKVDIRGVVFREGKLLMVREAVDGGWALPGGWADVNYSPFEIAEKEVFEEAGIRVKPLRLLAVFDKEKHAHPPDIYHIYKLFILCEDSGEIPKPGMETTDVAWIDRQDIPKLSEPRITTEQIGIMFEYLDDPGKIVMCD